ncbi:hypothetical protein FJZ18_04560 [Candidatus Pacearchaeota archaeon]|nr:hypothetical protein [Candidatus Pacearchaeota archaeon]
MTKALKVAYTLGIIFLLYFVIIFGIKAFYPELSYYDYTAEIKKNCGSYPQYETPKCEYNYNATTEEADNCKGQSNKAREEFDEKNNAYSKCSEKYNPGNSHKRNLFIIENILGLLLVITAFFLMRISMLSNGAAFAGVMLIIDGFYEGWRVSEKALQFGVGVIIIIVFITTAVLLHRKTNKIK